MPETIAAPTASPAPSPVAAQPSASPTTTASAGKSAAPDPEIRKQAEEALGPFFMESPEADTTTEEVQGATSPVSSDVAQAPQPGAASSPAGAKAGQTSQTPLPGDDYLKQLLDEGLLTPDQKPAPVAQELQVPTTPEESEKLFNPDGKATWEQKYQKAQSFIGELGRKKGELIKSLQAQVTQATQGLPEIAKHFVKGADGNYRATPETVFEFAQTIPQAEMEAALAKLGQKIVPLDAVLQSGEDPVENQWMREYVNRVKPGDELTYDEKLAEIEGSASLNRKLTTDLAAWKSNRRSQQDAYQRQEQQSFQVQRQRAKDAVDGFFAKVGQHPEAKEIVSEIVKWNEKMGPYEDKQGRPLPGAMPLPVRLQVLRALAEVPRFARIMRKAVTDAKAAGREEAMAEIQGHGAIPGSGESPDISARDVKPPEGQSEYSDTEMAAMKRSFGLR